MRFSTAMSTPPMFAGPEPSPSLAPKRSPNVRRALRALLATSALVVPAVVAPTAARGGSPLTLDISGSCGDGSEVTRLIGAMKTANAASGAVTILLAKGCTYSLGAVDNALYGPNGLPAVVNDITLEGQGAHLVRASSAPAFRFFMVAGAAAKTAGLVSTTGSLTLHDLTLHGGLARGGDGGKGGYAGGGGMGAGGAIYSQGTLSLRGVTLDGNAATGGNGGVGAGGPGGGGGGMGGNGGVNAPDGSTTKSPAGGGGAGGGGGMGGNGGTGEDGGGGGLVGAGLASTPYVYGTTGGNGGGPNGGVGSGRANGGSGGAGGGGAGAGHQNYGGLPDVATRGGNGGPGGGGGGGGTGGAGGIGGGGGGGSAALDMTPSPGPGGSGGFGGGGGGGLTPAALGGYGGGDGGSGGYGTVPSRPGRGGTAIFACPGGGGAGFGGALFVEAGTVDLANTTLANNVATGGSVTGVSGLDVQPTEGDAGGGAIFAYGGTVALTSATLFRNHVRGWSGGSVRTAPEQLTADGGTITVTSSIVWDDSAPGAGCVARKGAVSSGGANVVGPSCGTALASDLVATSAPVADLADNGGPSGTCAITAGSPAFTHGRCTLAVDQRGYARPDLTHCDSGAFELTAAVSITLAGSGTGVVSSKPTGIDCGASCSARWKPGAALELDAVADPGSVFVGWTGGVTASTPTTTLSLGSDVAVTATFALAASADAGVDSGSDTGTGASGDAANDVNSEVGGDVGSDAISTTTDAASVDAAPTVATTYQHCTLASECKSGFCVEGVCCDRACDGVCESCALAEAPGVCTPVPAARDPKGTCSAGASCAHTCDGHGSCIGALPGSQCAPAACIDATHLHGIGICATVGASSCDVASEQVFDCSPYHCDSTIGACATTCQSSADCASGYACDGQQHCVVDVGGSAASGGCAIGERATRARLGAIGALALVAFVARIRRRSSRR